MVWPLSGPAPPSGIGTSRLIASILPRLVYRADTQEVFRHDQGRGRRHRSDTRQAHRHSQLACWVDRLTMSVPTRAIRGVSRRRHRKQGRSGRWRRLRQFTRVQASTTGRQLALYFPLGSLARVERRVGGFLFGPDSGALRWTRGWPEWQGRVFQDVDFRLGRVGFEVDRRTSRPAARSCPFCCRKRLFYRRSQPSSIASNTAGAGSINPHTRIQYQMRRSRQIDPSHHPHLRL